MQHSSSSKKDGTLEDSSELLTQWKDLRESLSPNIQAQFNRGSSSEASFSPEYSVGWRGESFIPSPEVLGESPQVKEQIPLRNRRNINLPSLQLQRTRSCSEAPPSFLIQYKKAADEGAPHRQRSISLDRGNRPLELKEKLLEAQNADALAATVYSQQDSSSSHMDKKDRTHAIIELARRGLNGQLLSSSPSRPKRKRLSWRKGGLIGAGSYGKVYQALDEDTGEILAVKQLPLQHTTATASSGEGGGEPENDELAEEVRRLQHEINLLEILDHPNIVRYYGTEISDNSLCILMEFVSGGSLSTLIKRFGPLNERLAARHTYQILKGLDYLHSKGVVHRDIKGGNILVDTRGGPGAVKLGDFGASKRLSELASARTMQEAKSFKGTPYFMAPEVIRQSGHGRKADIWSIGCVVMEMLTGRPPYAHLTPIQALFHVASEADSSPAAALAAKFSKECCDFLELCFIRDPLRRPPADFLLRHPFLVRNLEHESLAGSDSPPPLHPHASDNPAPPRGVLIPPVSSSAHHDSDTSQTSNPSPAHAPSPLRGISNHSRPSLSPHHPSEKAEQSKYAYQESQPTLKNQGSEGRFEVENPTADPLNPRQVENNNKPWWLR